MYGAASDCMYHGCGGCGKGNRGGTAGSEVWEVQKGVFVLRVSMYINVVHRQIQYVARSTLGAVAVCFVALLGLQARTNLGLLGIWVAVRLLGLGRLVGNVLRLRQPGAFDARVVEA